MPAKQPEQPAPGSEIVLYQTEDGQTRIQVRLESGTVWLTQALLAELYQTSPQNITLHIREIYADGELDEPRTCKDFLQVRQEGGRTVERRLKHYNLDMILSVGYAENQARRHQPLYMKDWREKLDGFLRFNQWEILENAGNVSMEVAQRLALEQYEKFNEHRLTIEAAQDAEEFERMARRLERKEGQEPS